MEAARQSVVSVYGEEMRYENGTTVLVETDKVEGSNKWRE